ncbi:MAG: hypothetical protein KDK07_17255 [Bauldia sp.]|nr:hypothetical protein [Bauldia sp.]
MALPVVELFYGFPTLDPTYTFINALYDGSFTSVSSSKLVFQTDYGVKIVFKGDFTVAGNTVTGGTVESFKVSESGTKVMTETGLSISATALIDAINDWQTVDSAPLEDLLLDIPTKFIGSEQDDSMFLTADGCVATGRKGNDYLATLGFDAVLKGGKGDDRLESLGDNTKMSGGDGMDVFAFGFATNGKITDLSAKDDLIALDITAFAGINAGFLDQDQFKIGNAASTEDQIVIYQRSKGNLWYDQDGSGSTYDPVKIAKLEKGLDLTAHNFLGDFIGPMLMT